MFGWATCLIQTLPTSAYKGILACCAERLSASAHSAAKVKCLIVLQQSF